MPKFTKRIVRPGTYTVKRKDGTTARVYVGKQRIQKWIDNFNRMKEAGLQVPAPWRHEDKAVPVRLEGDKFDTDAYNNGGFWENLFVGEDGAMWGEVDVPRQEDADRVGSTVQDVSILAKPEWMDGRGQKYQDALTHIAFVTHPVDKDNKGFSKKDTEAAEEQETVALSLNDLLFANDSDSPGGGGDTEPEGPAPVNASTANVSETLQLLAEVAGISLPEDTTADNFLERLVTALSAIRGKNQQEGEGENSVREPPSGSKKQPGPVAMSKEQEIALSILNEHEVKNPETGAPYTLEELQARKAKDEKESLKLSSEDQAAINWARTERRNAYKSRIESCVSQGKVAPKIAKEFWDHLSKDEDLQFSFDAGGKPLRNQYDFVLESWESSPSHSALTGQTPTSAKTSKTRVFGEQAFSLSGDVMEEPNEGLDAEPASPEEIDNVLNLQFRSAGKRSSQVEGGLPAGGGGT